jgi:peptidoglycan hydrolase-like protein with peptidoglycan-binding domain
MDKLKKARIFQRTVLLLLLLVNIAFSLYYYFFSDLILEAQDKNVPTFDPSFVMDDFTFASDKVFPDISSIQNYLNRVNSPLKNFRENDRTAATIIYEASRGKTSTKYNIRPQINPGVIMAYLEKEMSLLSLSSYDANSDPDDRIKLAMGYGCPDTQECDKEYFGFSNQLNWASYQLQFNFDGATKKSNSTYPYHIGSSITTLDEYEVRLSNAATASSYRYTPHVYFGNYNLWKIITANGWGVSTLTYSYADIDSKNLANKDIKITPIENQTVSQEQGRKLASQKYYLGEKSDDIKNLQIYLRQEGFYMTRDFTGLFGTITYQALKLFRFDKGIVTGEFKNKELCINLINKKFNYGDQNSEVLELQKCFVDIGFFEEYYTTGFFGNLTTEAQLAARKYLDTLNPPIEVTPIVEPEIIRPLPVEELPTNNNPITNNLSSLCNARLGENYYYSETAQRVKELQECLQGLGLFNWPDGPTGYFGDYTTGKYKEWLNNVDNCNLLKSKPDWSQGETSDRVTALQTCMKKAGTFTYPFITGYFGPITEEALKNWKKQ